MIRAFIRALVFLAATALVHMPGVCAADVLDGALTGTVVVDGGRSFALFQPGDGLILTREGEEIVRGIRLLEVRLDRVMVDRQGVHLEIFLGAAAARTAQEPAPAAEVGRDDEPVRKIGDSTWQVDRVGVRTANQGLGRILAQVRLAPHFGDRGPDGITFTFIGARGLFEQLGFRVGDIVSRINGRPTRSVDEAQGAYDAAANDPSLRVDLLRDGKQVSFFYQLK